MTENLAIWNALKRPPTSALRTIGFGALKGKSDIDPMWRVKAMTEHFGPCGVGWKFEIKRVWSEPAPNDQTFAFAEVWVYINLDRELFDVDKNPEWSAPIPGIGGNMLVQLAKGNPKDNDEGYKMAVTDALGTALKMIGVAADIYMGKFDGSKYKDNDTGNTEQNMGFVEGDKLDLLKKLYEEVSPAPEAFLAAAGAVSMDKIPAGNYQRIMGLLQKKLDMMNTREPGSDDT